MENDDLINELKNGMELAKQLQIHLNVPNSSNHNRKLLVNKLLSSYHKALSIINNNINGSSSLKTDQFHSDHHHQNFTPDNPKKRCYYKSSHGYKTQERNIKFQETNLSRPMVNSKESINNNIEQQQHHHLGFITNDEFLGSNHDVFPKPLSNDHDQIPPILQEFDETITDESRFLLGPILDQFEPSHIFDNASFF
ncbi:uncharacterized protein LOC124928727 [Impatiens glandulifera]|uniref:uncharacterized protein LOC124928727 n=1 Tax=Impatiens glandulifera TaxID=253017 RepID=UPI001FB07B47|nr:uncharacterized protein LOC124928727 [Impatiens glandulifera]